MRSWRIRTKLALWSAVATGLALLTLGVVAAFNVYLEEVEEIDHHLATNAKLLLKEFPHFTANDWNGSTRFAQFFREASSLYGFAISEKDEAQPHVYPEKLETMIRQWPPAKRFFFAKIDGRRLRLGYFVDNERKLLVAADAAPARETVGELLGAYFLALPVVLLVVGVASWWIAGRGLRPITAITRAAEAITAERLDARLPAPLADDEIGRHTHVLNAMFDRLQRSFEQATRFTADASHELRTPLTILRGEIEEALRTSSRDAEQEKLLVSLLEQTAGLQKISANLLMLARFDAGKNQLERSTVDLSDLVNEAKEDAELLAAPSKISVSAEIASSIKVSGDAVLLHRLLLNLVENAIRYNRAEGEMSLKLIAEASVASIKIANTGMGIPFERHGELFQRFFRLDRDRNSAAGGSGLGLSLCREIAVAHGGSIALGRSDETWTEFVVRLPASPVLAKPAAVARE